MTGSGSQASGCLAATFSNIMQIILFVCQQNPLYCPERCCAFQCDLTKDDLRENVPEATVDVVTLIFVLSAVHPDKMKLVLQNISRVRADTARLHGSVQGFQYNSKNIVLIRFGVFRTKNNMI